MAPAKRLRRQMLATTIASALIAHCPVLLGAPADVAAACSTGETTFFACRFAHSSKVAVLCGHAGPPRPWLQYRVGVPGHPPELLVPKTIDDPEMTSTFFVDGPSATRDHSWWEIGVWFQNLDATYELTTSQDHEYQDGGDTASAILVWPRSLAKDQPKSLGCAGTSSSDGLLAARDVIAAMSPSWHGWAISPGDWKTWARNRDAERRAATPGAGSASAVGSGPATR